MDEDAARVRPAERASAEDKHRYKAVMADAFRHWREMGHEFQRKGERVADRALYRLRREAEGESVRAYRPIRDETRLPGETDDAFRARIRRERRRQAAGKSGPPRAYSDLSGLTPEQLAQHKREQAAERQRKRRWPGQGEPVRFRQSSLLLSTVSIGADSACATEAAETSRSSEPSPGRTPGE